MTAKRGTILYVGGFELPDRNAAAQRVLANAKLFESLGYEVAFLGYSESVVKPEVVSYSGFTCYELPLSEWSPASRIDIDRIIEICENRLDINYIIAYNYPSISLLKLINYCKSHSILCVGDITEWYLARDVSLRKRPLKYIDTALRMRFLNKRMDGLIAISSFLRDYYQNAIPTLLLPPLVDISDSKWNLVSKLKNDCTTLVYAGRPSKTKERLDLIVNALSSLSDDVSFHFDIVGITELDFEDIYGIKPPDDERLQFHGRVPHVEAIDYVKRSDYSVIIRDKNLVTKAGFPSKFAESVACGTPVICNENSDLKHWIQKGRCGWLVHEKSLSEDFDRILNSEIPVFDRSLFDYRNFQEITRHFLSAVDKEES